MSIRYLFWALAPAALQLAVVQAGNKGPEWLSKAVFYPVCQSSHYRGAHCLFWVSFSQHETACL